MHIEPVIPDLDYVRIRRTGGFMGIDQSLEIDRDLRTRVADRLTGDRSFQLDAWCAQELMEALSRLAATRPAPSSVTGCDIFHYDIELGFGGNVYRVSSVDIGADEALHGVMLAANRLIENGNDDHVHQMTLHAMAPQGA